MKGFILEAKCLKPMVLGTYENPKVFNKGEKIKICINDEGLRFFYKEENTWSILYYINDVADSLEIINKQ